MSHIEEDKTEIEEFERLFADCPAAYAAYKDANILLNFRPVGREIFWRDEVLCAPLPPNLLALPLGDFSRVYGLSFADRARFIRAGISVRAWLAAFSEMGDGFTLDMIEALKLDRDAIAAKLSADDNFGDAEGEKALGLLHLVGCLEAHAPSLTRAEGILPAFRRWAVTWHPALNLAPIDFMGSITGQSYLEEVIAAEVPPNNDS